MRYVQSIAVELGHKEQETLVHQHGSQVWPGVYNGVLVHADHHADIRRVTETADGNTENNN